MPLGMTPDEALDASRIVARLRDYLNEADHFFEVFSPIDRYDDGTIDDLLRKVQMVLAR